MQALIEPVAGGGPGDRGRPLVVTGDGELLDELVGLAAAGGVEVSVAVDAVAAEDRWASAPLVVVGADQAAALARRDMPRRLGVILVGRSASTGGPPDASTEGAGEPAEWRDAAALHPEHVVTLPDARPWLVTRFAECRPTTPRHAAPVVAFVPGNPGGGAGLLATSVALAARQQGLATLLVGTDRPGAATGPPDGPAELVRAELVAGTVEADATTASDDQTRPEPAAATLAVLSFDRSAYSGVPPDAMAAALRAARHGRDLVVVDLPHPYDDAARLALSCADLCYLTVVAGIRECTVAARVAAAVRRHCPRLALVVRVLARRGLRPDEVAEALDLPLAGVLPPRAPGRASPVDAGPMVAALSRRLLAQIGAARRSDPGRPPTPVSGVDEVMDL